MVFHVTKTDTEADYALKVIDTRSTRHLQWATAEFKVRHTFVDSNIGLLCCQFRCNINYNMKIFCELLIHGTESIITIFCWKNAMVYVLCFLIFYFFNFNLFADIIR